MKKYSYILKNLDCSLCARKIKERLEQEKKLNNVIVNFNNLKLSFETDSDIKKEDIQKIINSIEPDVTLLDKDIKIKEIDYDLIRLIIGIIIIPFALFISLPYHINEFLMIIAYLTLSYKIFINACKLFIKSKKIDENTLICVSCLGAYLVNQKIEGLMVLILYQIGEILEGKALNKSRNSIKDLMNIKQDFANKKIDNSYEVVDVEDIHIDDILLIKRGEKVPVDGVIMKGCTNIDISVLTGESDLIFVNEDDKVLSGSINVGDVIEIKVINNFEDSTVSKILKLVEEATDKKTKTETTVDKISRIYTPIIILMSSLVALFLPLIINITYTESIYRSLIFLVVSCPCAIAISVPLSYFTGIGVSSKLGILIKGSNYLDNLSDIKRIIFDKTGTITSGKIEVRCINIIDDNYKKEEIINLLVKGEFFSSHPIAKSIVNLTPNKIDTSDIFNYKEIPGKGITYQINDNVIKIGNKEFCNGEENDKSIVYLNYNDKVIANIVINDGIKDDVVETINRLRAYNIETYMFTGDNKKNAYEIAEKVGIQNVKSELLPQDKYRELEILMNDKIKIAFVGDGINDAPVLKRCDIGISMGGVGSNQAIEASDIVIMNDELSKIISAINVSKKTKKIIKQNLVFALLVKLLVLILTVFGISNMWEAVFSDVGVTLITILNTSRIKKVHKK